MRVNWSRLILSLYLILSVSEGVAAVRTVMTDVSEYLADAPRTVSGYIIPGVGCNEKKQCAGGIVVSEM